MAHTKLYAWIYVVLFAFATLQVGVEYADAILGVDLAYWTAFWVIIVLSAVKAVLVAGYYQHLRWEPRAVSYLAAGGVLAVIALTAAASYSMI